MPPRLIAPPQPPEYAPAFGTYIRLVPPGDVHAILSAQVDELTLLVGALTDEQALMRHPPYTWTIKQVVGHMTDCERIFACRALRIARNDPTPLPGFDENAYMRNVDFDQGPMSELLAEFQLLRRSHLLMFSHLAPDAWLRMGTVTNHPASVRAFAYVIAGHARHHLDILHKRLGTR